MGMMYSKLRQPGKSPSHCRVEEHARVLPKSVSRTAPNREQRLNPDKRIWDYIKIRKSMPKEEWILTIKGQC